MGYPKQTIRGGVALSALIAIAGCGGTFDSDLRSIGNGFDTSEAVGQPTAAPPLADSRGVISYPNYQVALARRGDTVSDVAARVGVDPVSLAEFNGIRDGLPLRDGEILALPNRVAEPSPATGAIATGPILPAGSLDVNTVAGDAINRAGGQTASAAPVIPGQQTGTEPIRHQVQPGETAFTIARSYNVTPRSLADWNGLGPDLDVRTGQYLLIPVAAEPVAAAPTVAATVAPGQGSVAPSPPSAATPLPPVDATPEPEPAPPSPQMAEDATDASDTGRLLMPVAGSIIRPYESGTNDGIGIAASAGTAVRAADEGTVAAITRDTDQIPIIVLRHADNLLTVYAGVDGIEVEKGDTVGRGETIAAVRDGSPSFLHFEVRDGFDSVDPMPFLN
ncbi:MAG: LysM peptidoglycan-binding domain-containing protein [Pseudomonadota bacterium]